MKTKKIKNILESKVEAVSTNTLDRVIRIKVQGKWFVECDNPTSLFGKPYVNSI